MICRTPIKCTIRMIMIWMKSVVMIYIQTAIKLRINNRSNLLPLLKNFMGIIVSSDKIKQPINVFEYNNNTKPMPEIELSVGNKIFSYIFSR